MFSASDPPSRFTRLLVVDDDAGLRQVLVQYFSARGCAVAERPDAADLAEAIAAESPALVVLDRMLPGEDGVSACRRLRAQGIDVPVILLTAKDDPIDRVIGLESGADDYVGKPFDPCELEARIKSVLRRPRRLVADEAAVAFGEFVFDRLHGVLTRNAQRIALSAGETALLAALTARPRVPLAREDLLAAAGGADSFDRAVDHAVSRLRRIVEPDAARPRYIQTVRGVGYVFVPDSP
jgi:two-component system phosphate regulon response regulator OmpR